MGQNGNSVTDGMKRTYPFLDCLRARMGLGRLQRILAEGEKNMKKTIARIILAVGLLVATGGAPLRADSPFPVPICWPNPCLSR
jgi:hypothetical protein